MRTHLILSCLVGLSLGCLVGCGDDDTTTTTTTSTTSGSGGGTTTSGMGGGTTSGMGGGTTSGMGGGTTSGMGGGTTSGMTNPCADACDALWACTQLDFMGSKICPGLTDDAATKNVFVDQCLQNPQCGSIGLLIGDGTDPNQCNSGINTISSLDMSGQFKAACEGT